MEGLNAMQQAFARLSPQVSAAIDQHATFPMVDFRMESRDHSAVEVVEDGIRRVTGANPDGSMRVETDLTRGEVQFTNLNRNFVLPPLAVVTILNWVIWEQQRLIHQFDAEHPGHGDLVTMMSPTLKQTIVLEFIQRGQTFTVTVDEPGAEDDINNEITFNGGEIVGPIRTWPTVREDRPEAMGYYLWLAVTDGRCVHRVCRKLRYQDIMTAQTHDNRQRNTEVHQRGAVAEDMEADNRPVQNVQNAPDPDHRNSIQHDSEDGPPNYGYDHPAVYDAINNFNARRSQDVVNQAGGVTPDEREDTRNDMRAVLQDRLDRGSRRGIRPTIRQVWNG